MAYVTWLARLLFGGWMISNGLMHFIHLWPQPMGSYPLSKEITAALIDSHLFIGVKAIEVIERHPDRIAHVHCKDIRGAVHAEARRTGKSFLDGVLAGMFTVPGDGSIDFGAVMRALQRIGYSGWIIVEAEQDPAIANPREYGALGLATLKREAAAAGLS